MFIDDHKTFYSFVKYYAYFHCLRALVCLYTSKFDDYMGNHWPTYGSHHKLYFICILFYIAKDAITLSIIQRFRHSQSFQLTWAIANITQFEQKLIKTFSVFYVIFGAMFHALSGYKLHANDDTVLYYLYCGLWSLNFGCFISTAIGVPTCIAISITKLSIHFTGQFHSITRMLRKQATSEMLIKYDQLCSQVHRANRMWRLILFTQVLCMVPVVASSTLFSTWLPDDVHWFLVLFHWPTVLVCFINVSYLILMPGRVESASRKCRLTLYSSFPKLRTKQMRLQSKLSLIVRCDRPNAFTLMGVAVCSYETYQHFLYNILSGFVLAWQLYKGKSIDRWLKVFLPEQY